MTSALPSRLTATTWRSIQLQNHSRPSCHRGDSGIPRPLSRTFGSDIDVSSLRRAAPAAGRLLYLLYERQPGRSTRFRLVCPGIPIVGEAPPATTTIPREPQHQQPHDGDDRSGNSGPSNKPRHAAKGNERQTADELQPHAVLRRDSVVPEPGPLLQHLTRCGDVEVPTLASAIAALTGRRTRPQQHKTQADPSGDDEDERCHGVASYRTILEGPIKDSQCPSACSSHSMSSLSCHWGVPAMSLDCPRCPDVLLPCLRPWPLVSTRRGRLRQRLVCQPGRPRPPPRRRGCRAGRLVVGAPLPCSLGPTGAAGRLRPLARARARG